MDINELTIGQAKQLASMMEQCNTVQNKQHDFQEGKKYFVRTVTHHYLGEVTRVLGQCIVMKNVTWVADDGRFNKAMAGDWDSNAEHEPYPGDMTVQLFYGAMLDACEWKHELITIVK